jgi:hypothetical protein
MATKAMVPVEEYLRMRFDGADMEYMDGFVPEFGFEITPEQVFG